MSMNDAAHTRLSCEHCIVRIPLRMREGPRCGEGAGDVRGVAAELGARVHEHEVAGAYLGPVGFVVKNGAVAACTYGVYAEGSFVSTAASYSIGDEVVQMDLLCHCNQAVR